jgi:hypothetical protein
MIHIDCVSVHILEGGGKEESKRKGGYEEGEGRGREGEKRESSF